jgi:PAS domain S-box-containing protein/putative nucleotidyltransferase with HDIG domain
MTIMKPEITILFLEDNQDDVDLCMYELRKTNYQVSVKIAETRHAFLAALEHPIYHLILADYQLPEWTGMQALQYLRQRDDLTPFILVTGAIGEETAAECMRLGADNYILKDNLTRLGPAIEQALRDSQIKQERKKALAALQESEMRLRTIIDGAIDAIFTKNIQGQFTQLNHAYLKLTERNASEMLGKTNPDLFPARLAETYEKMDQKVLNGQTVSEELEHVINGKKRIIHLNQVPLRGEKNQIIGICGFARDISDRKLAEERLRLTLEGAIQALMAIVEQRDPYTSGHQLRVSKLSVSIAQKMMLPPDQIEGLRMASMLHDVGKASLPAEILSKPSKLSDAESQIIHTHPILGANILRQIPFPWDLARFVEEHHEKLDGTGYPKGLQGNQISLEARIIGVADLVDSISSHRPYRPAKTLEEALDDLNRLSGIKYDSDVIAAIFKLVIEGYFGDNAKTIFK